ncbi:MAG: antibiotic biosynthesis monooxygenase [Xanthobacteraceae bacterium]|nr:antibiotic biosynthesis monooxygenase [Xanthobacteraceae bacterium]
MDAMAKMLRSRCFVSPVRWATGGCLALTMAAIIGAAPAAQAQSDDAVYAVTYLDVGTSSLPQGIDLLKKYRDASRKESANLEFTILQEASRPNRFLIMEGWKDQGAFEAHDKGAAKAAFEGALKPIRNSPPDRHMLQPFANAPSPETPASGALYMAEHVDFLGGDPSIAERAQPLVKALADASKKEDGVVRYDIYRQPPPRINHYEVIAAWKDAKAFDAHETAPHTLQFRGATAQGGGAWRANLYDQRLYRVL